MVISYRRFGEKSIGPETSLREPEISYGQQILTIPNNNFSSLKHFFAYNYVRYSDGFEGSEVSQVTRLLYRV